MTGEGPERAGEDAMWKQLEGLDDGLFVGSGDPVMDGFISTYNLLPEHSIGRTIGADVELQFADGSSLEFRPIAQYGNGFVARDLTIPIQNQDTPTYLFLMGSIVLSEATVIQRGITEVSQIISPVITRCQAIRTYDGETGLCVIYQPMTYCRDGRLVYAQAYSLEELAQQHMKTATAKAPLKGTVITVPIDGRPKVILIEEAAKLSEPISQAWQANGDDDIALLEYDLG